ncbi:hypothetical protein NIE88_04575 [Sporolactobacillus shoreicorticis]|uniref:Uncharacterized protein n=1 Tax=Sporolactobacillus shoreicorticis TaxID=1923877 RepID=A0ABW5RZ62_9BACL|nr:hypothetical protein [Sporolactobacillus shoreicorticis]MCO7125049.1 hypothetical protein [Sporolactobacillus shoreicorticis]
MYCLTDVRIAWEAFGFIPEIAASCSDHFFRMLAAYFDQMKPILQNWLPSVSIV